MPRPAPIIPPPGPARPMMPDQAIAKARDKLRRRINQAHAEQAQVMVGMRLHQLAFACVAPIATPFKMVRMPGMPGGVMRRVYTAKVAGDYYAIDPTTGVGVLCEVKRRDATTIGWSDFEEHQTGRLDAWTRAKGISLLAWVRPDVADGLAVVPWGFARTYLTGPRTSLPWAAVLTASLAVARNTTDGARSLIFPTR